MNRRFFLRHASLGIIGMAACQPKRLAETALLRGGKMDMPPNNQFPLVISTWNMGIVANRAAWAVLEKGGRALDAVENGVKVIEADPTSTSVGLTGAPDREGRVTLDACIMDEGGNAGSVCALEQIAHPISVARLVMEKTPHVMLVGEGAQQFALANGFQKGALISERAKAEWRKWLETSHYQPIINVENHDTIGMLAMDKNGDISGACTTSGLAYKMRGRVGDSPIIGAGLFVDNEIGAAVATGLGEAVLRTLGAFLIVELMRQGKTPQEACEKALLRLVNKHKNFKDFQVCYIAFNRKGMIGSYAIHKGFQYAIYQGEKNQLIDSDYYLK